MKKPIWTPSAARIERANMTAFMRQAAKRNASVKDYASLYAFSVDDLPGFWSLLWDYFGIVGDKGDDVLSPDKPMVETRWFPDASLNFAENHLQRRDDAVAIVSHAEGGVRRELSWRELYDEVSRLRAALAARGVGKGDRVAACLPNGPEAVIALLATTSLGAIWSACSPDYGLEAVCDRFSQIASKVLFVADGYRYDGKIFDQSEKSAELSRRLTSVEITVVVPFLDRHYRPPESLHVLGWSDFIASHKAAQIEFERFPFEHPVYILYSSGTTGKPKAIVHGAGGSLLQTMKELALHCDLTRDEPTFFQTTVGWVVWNIQVGALALGSPMILYDGSPTCPSLDVFFGILARERVTVARIVPPLIETYAKAGLRPHDRHDLSTLKCILAGSAPLLPHHYEYVYANVKPDLHLMSPAGGTDLMGALVSGNPIGPVYPGEIQCRSLGMMVEIYDQAGQPLMGEPGELVCTRPFPSVPLKFWGDPNNDRVREQYFSTFPGIWRHGDWAEITPEGGAIIYGRSDATLNVNGVRIGTAEIYRGLEKISEIKEAVAVAQRAAGNERIVLFVVMAGGHTLDDGIVARIKSDIRTRATARHVPAKVIAVPDLLRSLNGKPSEIAIRDLINGKPVSNTLGLSNPDLVEKFSNIAELRD